MNHLSPNARIRLKAWLIAGDPDGKVTLAWTIGQRIMTLYQLNDPGQTRTRAAVLIADLRGCAIGALARLGATLRAWRDELVAHFDHPDVSNGPTENLNLKIKNTSGSPAATATSPTTGCDCCSTTAASTNITHR